MAGTLFVVATPIGNLDDLTYRAEKVMRSVDYVAAEDSRVTRKLFNRYDISTKIISYHEHNEKISAKNLCNKLQNGSSIALVSDAGTPAISDPGYRLVNKAIINNIKVVSIPGPSSVTAALSISGLPTDHFFFEGFLPRKKGRKTRFKYLKTLEATIVIFESPFRVIKTLTDIQEYLGNRTVSICRELTKIYEETILDTVAQALDHFNKKIPKGEFTIMIAKEGYSISK